MDAFCRKYLNHPPTWVNIHTAKIPILYKNPQEVGADRLVNSIAAFAKYQTSLVIIDFGTATTFDCVSQKGEYLGGAICPGIMISSEALFQNTSKLPRVDFFDPPKSVIGKDTSESIKSGIIFGYAGLVDGIVKRIQKEMNTNPRIIATGGLASIMANVSETIEIVDGLLTLEGLKTISRLQ